VVVPTHRPHGEVPERSEGVSNHGHESCRGHPSRRVHARPVVPNLPRTHAPQDEVLVCGLRPRERSRPPTALMVVRSPRVARASRTIATSHAAAILRDACTRDCCAGPSPHARSSGRGPCLWLEAEGEMAPTHRPHGEEPERSAGVSNHGHEFVLRPSFETRAREPCCAETVPARTLLRTRSLFVARGRGRDRAHPPPSW
jgi:hypothetical protein